MPPLAPCLSVSVHPGLYVRVPSGLRYTASSSALVAAARRVRSSIEWFRPRPILREILRSQDSFSLFAPFGGTLARLLPMVDDLARLAVIPVARAGVVSTTTGACSRLRWDVCRCDVSFSHSACFCFCRFRRQVWTPFRGFLRVALEVRVAAMQIRSCPQTLVNGRWGERNVRASIVEHCRVSALDRHFATLAAAWYPPDRPRSSPQPVRYRPQRRVLRAGIHRSFWPHNHEI